MLTGLFFSILMCQWTLRVHAISWMRTRHTSDLSLTDDIPPAETFPPADIQDSFTPQELDQIFSKKDALDSYSRKPDCFRRVAGLLRTRCGEIDMNEEDRVSAAISLTLCELATATHHSPPLECAPFSPNFGSEPIFAKVYQSQANCVEAFSRSAQFWSSYSGYLREVPQLCFAFRRWHDIDTAKDTYKNATVEKIALIRLLSRHIKHETKTLQTWDEHLHEMRDLFRLLRTASLDINTAFSELSARLYAAIESALEPCTSTLSDLRNEISTGHAESVVEMGNALRQVSADHVSALSSLIPSFDLMLERVSTIAEGQHLVMIDRTENLLQRWSALETNFSMMQNAIQKIMQDAMWTSDALQTQVDQADAMKTTHFEIAQSAAQSMEMIELLTRTTHAELGRINETAVALRDRISIGEMDGVRRFAMALIGHADLPHFNRLPFIPFLGAVMQLLGMLVKATVSTLMSLFMLLTCKRYFRSSMGTRSPFSSSDIELRDPDPTKFNPSELRAPSYGIPLDPCPAESVAHDPRRYQRLPILFPDRSSSRRSDHRFQARPRFSRIPDRLCVTR